MEYAEVSGGLALAQILQANKVPFQIFERDDGPSTRKQGWAVALIESLPALKNVIPAETYRDLHTTSVNHETGDFDELAIMHAETGEVAAKIGGVPLGEPGSLLRANREALREYLWSANDLPVSKNKEFVRYEEDENGVTAFFKDGGSARGRLIVGADGLHCEFICWHLERLRRAA